MVSESWSTEAFLLFKKEYYKDVMQRLHEAIRVKQSELRNNKKTLRIMLHDSPSAHTSTPARDFIVKNNKLKPPPAYLSDYTLYSSYSELKTPMRRKWFATTD